MISWWSSTFGGAVAKRRKIDWWTPARRKKFRKAWRAFAKRRASRVRGAKARAAKKELRRIRKGQTPEPPPPMYPGQMIGGRFNEPESWDVTVHYPPDDGSPILDFSIRMNAKGVGAHEEAKVRGAFWYALLHGASSLKSWDVTGFDWYKGGRLYHYDKADNSLDDALFNARGVFKKLGIGGFRVALVDE